MKKKLFPIEVLSIYGQVLSAKEVKLLQDAQYIVGGKALLKQIAARQNIKGKECLAITSPLENIFKSIEQARAQSKQVLVLADGDALYYGIGVSLIKYFGQKSVHIYPGISVMQNLCARLGIAWHNVQHVSLHGRPAGWHRLNVALFSHNPVCVLTDAKASPKDIANYLYERGARNFTMHIAQNLGQEDENIFSLSLAKALHHNEKILGYCTLLIEPTAQSARPVLGLLPKQLARENNLMTKFAVRATALSLLRIEPEHTLWDIGSGSGSVALEMCALAYAGQVIAVEKKLSRIKDIEKNRRTTGALILDICQGSAPQCLHNLPRPHGIFVGGGLSDLDGKDLLKYLSKSLISGGRMVISCVLLGTLQKVEKFFNKRSFKVEVFQLGLSHSSSLGQDIRLVPENPVFLVLIEKI